MLETANVLHVDRKQLFKPSSTAILRLRRGSTAAIAMFLSARMRNTVQRLGYGRATVVDEDEIDMALLDTVTIAGSRFDRMIKS